MKIIKHITIILLLILISVLFSCKKLSVYKFSTFLMGTIVNLTIVVNSGTEAQKLSEGVFSEVRRIEGLMSPYNPDSDIFRVNCFAWKRPVKISEETLNLIQSSIDLSSQTDGSFDITFASLSGIWNFNESFKPPSRGILSKYLPFVNYKFIEINLNDSCVRLSRKGTKIGLGGIAKGHAINRGLMYLKDMGVKSAIVEAGGDLQVLGGKFGKHWQVGLVHPRSKEIFLVLLLHDMDSIATSGDYERFVMYKKKRYHHLINPETGFPAQTFASMSIISDDAVLSDSMATALFVMGEKRSRKFLSQNRGVLSIMIDKEMKVSASKELKERIFSQDKIEIKWF